MAAQMYTRLRSVVAYSMFGCWFTQEISLSVPLDKAEGRTNIGDGLNPKYATGDREWWSTNKPLECWTDLYSTQGPCELCGTLSVASV